MSKITNEIEVKVLNIDKSKIIDQLAKLNVVKILDDVTSMVWYDVGSTRIKREQFWPEIRHIVKKIEAIVNQSQSLRQAQAYLRLRRQADNYDFTLKVKNDNKSEIAKIDTEYFFECKSAQAKKLNSLLVESGFIIVGRHEKKRLSYVLPEEKLRFDIDEWPKIPPYLEIEGSSEDTVKFGIKLLGLEDLETTVESGENFFKRYNQDFYSSLTFNHKEV